MQVPNQAYEFFSSFLKVHLPKLAILNNGHKALCPKLLEPRFFFATSTTVLGPQGYEALTAARSASYFGAEAWTETGRKLASSMITRPRTFIHVNQKDHRPELSVDQAERAGRPELSVDPVGRAGRLELSEDPVEPADLELLIGQVAAEVACRHRHQTDHPWH